MAPYIFMERNGIHVIDLHKTDAKLEEATEALKKSLHQVVKSFSLQPKASERNRSEIRWRCSNALRN